MKSTFISALAATLLTSSVWADTNKVTLTGIKGDLTCSTFMNISGYFHTADAVDKTFTYGLWLGEETSSKDASVATIVKEVDSTDVVLDFEFLGYMSNIGGSLYDGSTLSLDRSKDYYVYSFIAPGKVTGYKDGQLQTDTAAVANSDVFTSIGGSFPPTDSTKFIKFDLESCPESDLPSSEVTTTNQ